MLFSLQGTRRRVLYVGLYELLAIAIVTVVLLVFTGEGPGRLGAGNTVEPDDGTDEGIGDATFGTGMLWAHDAQPGRETVAGSATP